MKAKYKSGKTTIFLYHTYFSFCINKCFKVYKLVEDKVKTNLHYFGGNKATLAFGRLTYVKRI